MSQPGRNNEDLKLSNNDSEKGKGCKEEMS